MTKYEELAALQRFAEIGRRFQNTDLEHLDAPMAAFNYIRMADSIEAHLEQHPLSHAADQDLHLAGHRGRAKLPFLDWGAGYGQVTWLLRNRGINAQGYNVEEREHVSAIPELAKLPMTFDPAPVKLPFADNSFSGVSSCGVLEHVPDPAGSLKEICRVLVPGGRFFLFMLPQKTSWSEYLSEIRGISVHPVRYTLSGTRALLKENGFAVEKMWKFNLLPKNLTGLPAGVKKFYGRFYRLVYPLDGLLSRIPLLNILSGVIEGVARKG